MRNHLAWCGAVIGMVVLTDCGKDPNVRPLVAEEEPQDADIENAAVGPHGGAVTKLKFGVTGDTRPSVCNYTRGYPEPVITSIADAMKRKRVQFALDVGDHMFACHSPQAALDQMAIYQRATQRLAHPWFMTMGNHECGSGTCLPDSTDANYTAYMSALAPVSATPWYSFDVTTEKGIARFVFIAENAWGPEQKSWLEAILQEADVMAQYTIVSKHFPTGHADGIREVTEVLRGHSLALLITGHQHKYLHTAAFDGREIVAGIGGAPLTGINRFNGYALVEQQPSGDLRVSAFNVGNDTLVERWSVSANPKK
jgi:hypothetical protein